MIILISGGTGLVGTALTKELRKCQHTVRLLVRGTPKNDHEFHWDANSKTIDERAFEGVESIIHLAGASIARRWSDDYKKVVIESRTDTAELLFETANRLGLQLDSYISASGINYYGTFTSEEILNEQSPILNKDFLSEVCVKWEAAARPFKSIAERVVILRTAPVLAKDGGSFEQLKKISDYNLAAGIGSGKQWFNWIHLDDMVQMYVEAVENSKLDGPYNAVADEIPTNRAFMKKLAAENHKLFLPINVPAFVMKLAMGEMSEMILEGTRVSNAKIKSQGFKFKYPTLEPALKDLLS